MAYYAPLLLNVNVERKCCYTTESSLSFGDSVALAVILTFLYTGCRSLHWCPHCAGSEQVQEV